MKLMRFVFSFVVILIFASCSSEQIIEDEKFVEIYSEVLLAQTLEGGDPETTSKILEKICKQHNITVEQYESTVNFYKADYKGWELFFEKVVKILEKKKLAVTSAS